MILERTQSEILVRLPSDIDVSELQNMLDYFKYKEATAKSKAAQKDVDMLAEMVNKSIWEKFKNQLDLK